MIQLTLKEAMAIAFDYWGLDAQGTDFKSNCRISSVCEDIGDRFVFSITQMDGAYFIGAPGLSVYKKDGRTEWFILLDEENFKLLDKGKTVPLPA